VELSGKSAAKGPVTVQLSPTASARFLLRDQTGRPVPNRKFDEWPDLRLVITLGPDFGELSKNADLTPGDFACQSDLDPVANRGPRSGADGRVTMTRLVPGAMYRFRGHDFTPAPGQIVDLEYVVVDSAAK